MNPPRPTELAHWLLSRHLEGGERVADATAGNGHDTLFLARAVGRGGRVLAFDIQPEAIASARARLADAGWDEVVEWHLESHERLAERTPPASLAAVTFNLGYLPGHDHSLATRGDGTLAALEACRRALRPGGLLTIVCYPGHPGGAEEAGAVEAWCAERAAEGWRLARYGHPATRRPSPFLLAAARPSGAFHVDPAC